MVKRWYQAQIASPASRHQSWNPFDPQWATSQPVYPFDATLTADDLGHVQISRRRCGAVESPSRSSISLANRHMP
jgi:hypothetical protein